jgi:hypothetical protein
VPSRTPTEGRLGHLQKVWFAVGGTITLGAGSALAIDWAITGVGFIPVVILIVACTVGTLIGLLVALPMTNRIVKYRLGQIGENGGDAGSED